MARRTKRGLRTPLSRLQRFAPSPARIHLHLPLLLHLLLLHLLLLHLHLQVLDIGVEQGVDLVLLGGDLFHENKPSRQAEIRCMQVRRLAECCECHLNVL